MTVKEIIRQLKNFNEDLYIEVRAEYDCGLAIAGKTVDSVYFKNGNCVLFSLED